MDPLIEYAYDDLFPAMWLAWAAYWLIGALNVKTTVRRESAGSRLSHMLPLLLAWYLLSARHLPIAFLDEPLLPPSDALFWIGAAITAAGLLFTVWARVHLGRNWSGTVTLKEGHELITSGPYAIVRHPIYTGLLVAFVGSGLARAEWRGVLAVALVFASFWRKLGIEERWMREQFGEAYENYARRVKALVPYVL